jgi:diguanylate cyclase (GGDEF)-like protein
LREDLSIAIIAPTEPEDFFDVVWQGVWEATFDLAAFGVQVQNLTTPYSDVAGQEEILRQLLDDPVDSIAILPAHVSALNALIDEHDSRGTAVLTFHSDAPESRRCAFVGPNPFQSGVLAGEVLAKLMGECGRIVCFPGSLEKHHLSHRYQGFRAELASHPGCFYDSAPLADSDPLPALSPDLLKILRSAEGIYVGDERPVEIAALLEQAGVSAPCVGFGNTDAVQPFLARKTVSAIIDQHRYLQGYFAVQKAYDALLKREKGAKPDGVVIASDVAFAANAYGREDSMRSAFELLLRQRTQALVSYKQKLEAANAELLSLSVTDPLTGLLNRRRFEEIIQNEVARALRYGPLSLLMIDLNFFKAVNDRHGHQAGDEVLKAVARVLRASCRETDTCARLGGDEFAVILPHAGGEAAAVVRDRILAASARTMVPVGEEAEVPISLSIGAATLDASASHAPELIAAADADMYRVKQASRAERVPAPAR